MSGFNNKYIGNYKGVEGWLLFLCFILTIGNPLFTVYGLITSFNESSQYFNQFPGLENLLYIDGILSIALIILSIRAGIALWRIKPGAVKTAKNYLWLFLGYSAFATILPFTAGLPSEANEAMITEAVQGFVKSLFYFGVWYWYLTVSKRVAATYITFSNSQESENSSTTS